MPGVRHIDDGTDKDFWTPVCGHSWGASTDMGADRCSAITTYDTVRAGGLPTFMSTDATWCAKCEAHPSIPLLRLANTEL